MRLCAIKLHVTTVQELSRRVDKEWQTLNFAPLFSAMSAVFANDEKRFLALLSTGDVPVDL